MPEKSRQVYATHVGRFSRVIDAPLSYAYRWCTDYRTDDGKYSNSRPKFRVLRLSKDRLVRVRTARSKARSLGVAVEVVRLRPPDAWHVDQIDERDFDSVDYRLTRLGPKRTRITLVLVERWMVPNFPKKVDWVRDAIAFWERLIASLEDDYRAGLPAAT